MTDTTETPADEGWAPTIATAAVVGVVGAVTALVFVAAVDVGLSWLWPEDPSPDPFSGPWRTALIPLVAGVLVGIVHTLNRRASEENVFVALGTGSIDRRAVPGALLIALFALVGGFSLGPEVPTGMAAAGVAAWWGHRRAEPEAKTKRNVQSAITGAWGGLFTAPFVAALLNIELGIERRIMRWREFAADAMAAITGFAVFFAVDAGWSKTLRLLELDGYDLELWHLLAAAGLGIVGAILATMFKLSSLFTRRLAAPLDERPLTRSILAGAVMGLIGFALPLTLFLGTDGLVQVTENPEAIGIGLILISVVAKLLVTSGALSFGFVGGPVFPLLFVGGGVGSALTVVAPNLPEGLAVPAMMAATAAAVIPAPLSLAAFAVLIGGVSATELAPVVTAAIVAFAIGRFMESSIASRRGATNP